MNKLKKILLDEIEEFRKQGHEFCEGKMSVMDFKKISGGMGHMHIVVVKNLWSVLEHHQE